jgi:hypothetical protein
MERPKVGPKGTQAARVAARESAEGNPLWGEMSGSERVNIDERKRASQIERILRMYVFVMVFLRWPS